MSMEENHRISRDLARMPVRQQQQGGGGAKASPSMEALAQDLHSALEESTADAASAPVGIVAQLPPRPAGTPSRRRAWRRRCKSTSNLSSLAQPTAAGGGQQESEDSTTSSCEDLGVCGIGGEVPLGIISRGDRGTSSLQLTDSDDGYQPPPSSSAAAAATAASKSKDHALRKKRGGSSDQGQGGGVKKKQLPIESDSVNENFSPIRPNTKRKRKFKRMALDPEPAGPSNAIHMASTSKAAAAAMAVNKRQKVRYAPTASGYKIRHQPPPAASLNIVVGKRKRSNREKSVEPEHLLATRPTAMNVSVSSSFRSSDQQQVMDCDDDDDGDDRQSTSSLSSTEWDDDEDSDNPNALNNSREADDEQSDWPGYDFGATVMTDDDEEEENESNASGLFSRGAAATVLAAEAAVPMTATARQAYLARMKRLAECVPGREIRAGARKLRQRQTAFTIKSSSSEQLSRFLQDPTRSELKLTVLRATDRSKLMHLANLYSLSVRCEGSNLLVLSKTGRTVRLKEFAVPGAPAKAPVEFKRRRRTPPNSPLLEGSSASNEPPETSSAAMIAATTATTTMTITPMAAETLAEASSDVSMQPSPFHNDEDEELMPHVPSLVTPTVTSNRSDSPTLGASEPKADKAKFSGSLSN